MVEIGLRVGGRGEMGGKVEVEVEVGWGWGARAGRKKKVSRRSENGIRNEKIRESEALPDDAK